MDTNTPTENQNTGYQRQASGGNPPLDTHRDGAVSSKVWGNMDKNNNLHLSITFQKTYTDKKTGKVGETRNLTADDMYKIPGLAEKARESVLRFREMDKENAKARSQHNMQTQQQSPQQQGLQQQAPLQDMSAAHDQAMAQAAPDQQPTQPAQTMTHSPER